jgi:Zn-dependent oligopeptidase
MKELLQAKCTLAGAEILRMELMEFAYHPEMAQALLQVQQAQAKIDARKLIVEGGVLIVKDALQTFEEEGVDLDNENKERLTKELMLITCAEGKSPSAVINI